MFVNGEWICGEWVYGCFGQHTSLDAIIIHKPYPTQSGDLAALNFWNVIPETVGQYTGMTDNNGRKIFEGDILKEPDVMHNGQIQIPGEIACVVMDEGCYFVSYGEYANFLSNVCDKWEIIGNINGNPELMEEKIWNLKA